MESHPATQPVIEAEAEFVRLTATELGFPGDAMVEYGPYIATVDQTLLECEPISRLGPEIAAMAIARGIELYKLNHPETTEHDEETEPQDKSESKEPKKTELASKESVKKPPFKEFIIENKADSTEPEVFVLGSPNQESAESKLSLDADPPAPVKTIERVQAQQDAESTQTTDAGAYTNSAPINYENSKAVSATSAQSFELPEVAVRGETEDEIISSAKPLKVEVVESRPPSLQFIEETLEGWIKPAAVFDEANAQVEQDIPKLSLPVAKYTVTDQIGDELFKTEPASEEFVLPLAETDALVLPEFASAEPRATNKLPLPVEKVEQVVHELAKQIEELEAEEIEIVHQMLDEIAIKVREVHRTVELDTQDQQDGPEKIEEYQQELNELFIQLFETVGIDYTQELIDYCVKLALRQGITELIVQIGQEDTTDTTHDRGTHEVIKQILAGINNLKRAMTYAYLIGKSAMRFYAFEYSTA